MEFEPTAGHVCEMDILGPMGGSCMIATVSFTLLLVEDSWRPTLAHALIMQSFSSSVRNLEISSLTPVTSPKHG
ncbi:unnamed protein product [Schistosoma curassoni]|uniref:Uncharacterized protein n=1 Tax=Schistosoma curassoni TaxID=6186 RepID=A0A183JWG4_9TREM|nr:unnamed protein product [Schistosoma curassoni]